MTAKQVRFVTNDEPFDNQNVAELAAFDAACVLSSCYRPVWREFSFRKSGRF